MPDLPGILDDLPIGVWVGNAPDGTIAYVNRACERILGTASGMASRIGEGPQTHGIFDRGGNVYPVDKLPFARVLATGGPVMLDDIVIRRGGRDIDIRAFATPVFGAEGTLSHVIVAFLDISSEIAAERERAMVEERLRFVCNHAPIAIWMTDTLGTITMSEGAGLVSLGLKSGELVGQNVLDVYGAHPTIPGYIRRGLAGEAFWYTVEVGEAVYETWVTPLRNPGGEMVGMAALSNDVSQLRKLQKTHIQNDRVMAIGTLAASVAHEINNPLTYVIANGDAVDEELDALEGLVAGVEGPQLSAIRASVARIREALGPVRSGASRIAAITRDLRTFSRPDDSSLAPVRIQAVVDSVLKLVAKEVEARARLVLDLDETPRVIGNEARLVQVILNLIVNAYQALPPASPAANEVRVRTRNEGERVIVEISDSGPGVPLAERGRIFEPFFTTKEIGQGTGLGLFVCRNIVRGISGEVEVDDGPAGGALFRVILPAAPAGTPAGEVPAPSPPPDAAGRHVLVIDDDALVARALSLQLRQVGFRVTVLGDGQAGLKALLAGDDIDVAFCDLMMTGMTGMDLAEALATRAPGATRKLVFMTGGAFSPRAQAFIARHPDSVVHKPFDVVAETRRRLDPRD